MQYLKAAAMLIGGGAMLLGGCHGSCPMSCPVQRIKDTPPEAINDTPLVVDPAMQVRDWDRSSAYYASGGVVAGPTGFLYEPKRGQPEWHYALLESPLFLVQTIALPVTLAFNPPWSKVVYKGVTVEPTYTAMPALPPARDGTAAP